MSARLFNPCSLEENEQIPAKIWELLRRNTQFRTVAQRLISLDAKEKDNHERTGNYHGAAWQRSWHLLKRIERQHQFASVALQWLVPEPLFHCKVATWPRGKKWKKRGVFATRYIRIGHGVTPDVTDPSWVWRNPERLGANAHPMRRGPEIHLTKSKFKLLRDSVNPIWEWSRYSWPFTVDHSWAESPAEFRRQFEFIWRRDFDCRPFNPITQDRSDCASPHEITFFHDWNLSNFQQSGKLTQKDLYQLCRFYNLAGGYRVFAIPETILTKASADEMGQWLAETLKKGSRLYGNLLDSKLLNEGEMFGTTTEWTDWLPPNADVQVKIAKNTHFYRRCHYMTSLVKLTFPKFQIGKLLAPPHHRARGKKYVRK
jgi:hypothetical protein